MPTRVIEVKDHEQVAAAAKEGARALRAGKLVGFATETVYGVAAMATDKAALRRLRGLKDRPKNPFSVHFGPPADAGRYVAEMPRAARLLAAAVWPGPMTLIVPAGGELAERRLQKAGLYRVLCRRDMIGLRCCDEPVARAMLSAVKDPVVATSANLAGKPSPRTAGEVLVGLGDRIDLLIDSGPARLGKDSTIVRVDADGWEVVRTGVYDARAVRRLIRRRVLFVCTGNTCRSPMAAGLAKKLLAEEIGCKVSELRTHGVEIASAGVFAADGMPATPDAVQAARAMGADISRHRSRELTGEMVGESDILFCMTASHVAQARQAAPDAAERALLLRETADVPDPIGGGRQIYRRTAAAIEKALRNRLGEGLL